jgi:hypothetical protein
MPARLHLSVPQPCNQQWEDMTFTDRHQRHCISCNKLIFDFTQMSDEELIAYFGKNTVSCGKFAPHQLNRTIYPPKKTKRGWMSAMLFPVLMGLNDASAQQTATQNFVNVVSDSTKLDLELPITAIPVVEDTVVVQGRVLEKNDSLGESPLIGAVVTIHLNDSTRTGGVSDVDGNFQIHLDSSYAGDSVEVSVSLIGYETFHTTIVLLKQVVLPTVIVSDDLPRSYIVGALPMEVLPAPSKTRRFFWRLFHPRSWFR